MSTQVIPADGIMPPLPEIEENEQWKEKRRLHIGGSDEGSVFSVGYGCARKLAYDKLGVPRDFPMTEQQERILRRGHKMEALVADEYSEITGRKIRRAGMVVSKEYPWMAVNVDRIILNDERGPGVLECKTANPWVFDKFEEEGLSEEYALQLQHGMIVKGYKWGAFAVMNASTWEMLIFERELNQELAPVIIQRGQEFWANIETGTLPDQLPKANDKRCAGCPWRKTCRGQAQIIPDKDDGAYIPDESLSELGEDYIQLANRLERDKGALEDCKQQLQQACGDREHITIPSLSKRIRFAWQKGRSGWDSKGLQAVIENVTKKAKGNPELEQLAISLNACNKTGAPSRPFYFEEWDGNY